MINSLIQKLKQVNDFRRPQGRRHELWIILMIVILGSMLGFNGYRPLEDFCNYYREQISILLKISTNKIPSYSTIRRVILNLDYQHLTDIFNEWSKDLVDSQSPQQYLSIDGKSLRNTLIHTFEKSQNFVVVVSLFNPENNLVLNLKFYENKQSSEIKEVQQMIRDTDLKNTTFTLDALHCQQKRIAQITTQNNNYIIPVKKNQKKLYDSLESLAQEKRENRINIQYDYSRGRKLTRKVTLWDIEKILPTEIKNKFQGIKTLIKVERSGIRNKKKYQQTVYYITDRENNSVELNQKIRDHWKIENKLHWVKDVIMKEDESKIKNITPAINISILKTIALNLFRLLKFESITKGQRWLSTRLSGLFTLLE